MQKDFECEICKKNFGADVSLNQHKNAKHDTNLSVSFESVQPNSNNTGRKSVGFSIKLPKKVIALILVIAVVPIGHFVLTVFGNSATVQAVAYIPLKRHNEHILGSPNAPVEIVEFGDFQCPFCRRFSLETEPTLRKDYIDTGKVRLKFKQFIGHTLTERTAEAAECADDQDKYWGYHDKLYEFQNVWQHGNVDNELVKYASDLGLNGELFKSCLGSKAFKDTAKKEMAEARNLGVQGTPTFLINGKRVVGAQPYYIFKQLIDSELNI